METKLYNEILVDNGYDSNTAPFASKCTEYDPETDPDTDSGNYKIGLATVVQEWNILRPTYKIR